MMIREFEHHVAWTDVMKEGAHYIGLIEFQRKLPCTFLHSSGGHASLFTNSLVPSSLFPDPIFSASLNPASLKQASKVQALWVYNGRKMNESEAEDAAIEMLEQIDHITVSGKVIYKDGIAL